MGIKHCGVMVVGNVHAVQPNMCRSRDISTGGCRNVAVSLGLGRCRARCARSASGAEGNWRGLWSSSLQSSCCIGAVSRSRINNNLSSHADVPSKNSVSSTLPHRWHRRPSRLERQTAGQRRKRGSRRDAYKLRKTRGPPLENRATSLI